MKQQNLKNKEIDQIGSRLLKVTKPSNNEIEKIVGNPHLFNSIKTRIKADKQIVSESKGLVNWNWLKSSFLNRQMAISAVAILVVFGVFGTLIVIKNQESTDVSQEKKIVKPQIQPEIVKAEDSLNDSKTKVKKDFAPEKAENSETIFFKKKAPKSLETNRKKNVVKPQYASAKSSVKSKRKQKRQVPKKASQQVAKNEPKKIFYSLPFAENSQTSNENLQIINTKLSRSELFALGVYLQLENESSTVETELIIGDDGVARAIRVVEKH